MIELWGSGPGSTRPTINLISELWTLIQIQNVLHTSLYSQSTTIRRNCLQKTRIFSPRTRYLRRDFLPFHTQLTTRIKYKWQVSSIAILRWHDAYDIYWRTAATNPIHLLLSMIYLGINKNERNNCIYLCHPITFESIHRSLRVVIFKTIVFSNYPSRVELSTA